ncbi:MAG: EAL domain-containing protein [Gammaproteobacteria bacterium]|nr:EAL domain-containing protein [Gammaproteobacteria bacterium]
MSLDNNQKSRFISLVWRITLAVSIATLAASTSVYVIGKLTLDKNYSQERERRHELYKQAYQAILKKSSVDDITISWLIPAFLDPQSTPEEALHKINELIDENWFKIGLESDIESAYLFSRSAELIGKWGVTVVDVDLFSDLFNHVVENEQPVDQIICTHVCTHVYVSPFLHNGKFVGVFIFAIDLASTVLQMKAITGADIGILIKETKLTDNKLAYLDKYSSRVVALTGYDRNLPLLRSMMEKFSIEQLKTRQIFSYQHRQYEASTIPFIEGNATAELIVIDDVSKDLADIQKATRLYAVNGLLILLLSGGLILILLIGPSRRLRALSSVMPMIAEKRYDKVSELLPKYASEGHFQDEITILDKATHYLTDTLKNLDGEVEKRTRHLSEKTKELQREKNFVSNILNTAQVIIMTLDENGKIVSLNKYGERLLGLYDFANFSIKFTDLISDAIDFKEITSALKNFSENQQENFNYECNIASERYNKLFISWYFTQIRSPHNALEILAVGLDLTERNQIESQLTWLADHDPLTNLYNRRRFEHELKRSLSISSRYGQSGALIYFDIDQFKFVNDSSGHKIGDQLLVRVADKLRFVTRDTDIVARVGGDEFAVLAPQVTLLDAKRIVDKICAEVTTIEVTEEKSVHRASISAGLLIYPIPGYSEQDLMASVDLAMYNAKQTNRGGWCLASVREFHRDEIRTKVNWKFNIQKGLQDDRFLLYLQPIKQISDGTIAHYECLLRLKNEENRIVSPSMFLPVAEQTGLMSLIDRRVLELAFQQQAEFMDSQLDIILSVNLSGEFISSPEAIETVVKLLKKYNIPASRFIFEITESQAVTNLYSAQNFMRQIHNIGGQFALDDFGVGFSSMSYLKHLPVQYLKIDGGFVKNLDIDQEDKLFIQAINSVGRGMGLKTIAEFVENDQIYETLRYIGIDYAQGYAIGKPLATPEFHVHTAKGLPLDNLKSQG